MNRQPLPDSAHPSRYQAFISALFLVAVALMLTQYSLIKYGPAWVALSPLGVHGPDVIAEEVEDQGAGFYVIDWATFDQVAYRLDAGQQLPPAEGLVALLALLAVPLLFIVGRRQVWPRAPAWILVGVAGLSLSHAEAFMPGVREVAQLVLTLLVAWWVAGVALVEPSQLRRLNAWLGFLTVVLLLLATVHYYQYILLPPYEAERPTFVRATMASRAAFGGAMVMLLALAFARFLAGGHKVAGVFWGLIALLGTATLMHLAAVVAVLMSWLAMALARGRGVFVATLILAPALVLGLTYGVSYHHWDHLRDSVWPFALNAEGEPVGVQKPWLEFAAQINALGGSQPLTGEVDGAQMVVAERDNAVLGVGPGLNYQNAIGMYYYSLDNPEKQEPDTYNLYLLLAVQMGLFAALVWAWLLLDGGNWARRGYVALGGRDAVVADPGLRAIALGVYGAAVGIFFYSLMGTVLIRGVALLLFTLLAAGARVVELERRARQPVPVDDEAIVGVGESEAGAPALGYTDTLAARDVADSDETFGEEREPSQP